MNELVVGTGYGRTVGLRGPADRLVALRDRLPIWWRGGTDEPEVVFDLGLGSAYSEEYVLRDLESWVAQHAEGLVFLHAAVVAIDGRAMVLPGHSFSGKTTLCRELLARGAVYLSDEYAVLDSDLRVHPYPRPLHVRENGRRYTQHARDLGAPTAGGSCPVGLVAAINFVAGSTWEVHRSTPGTAALRLFEHTVPVRVRPEESLDVVSRLVAEVGFVHGTRGPASDAVGPLTELLSDGGQPPK